MVEHFKEIENVPIKIVLISSLVLFPNLVFFRVSLISSLRFSASFNFPYDISLGNLKLHSFQSLHPSFLSSGELLGKFRMLHYMPLLSR